MKGLILCVLAVLFGAACAADAEAGGRVVVRQRLGLFAPVVVQQPAVVQQFRVVPQAIVVPRVQRFIVPQDLGAFSPFRFAPVQSFSTGCGALLIQ